MLLGLPLKAGDEIVCSAHDYYAMLDALEQRRSRDDVVLTMVTPPVPPNVCTAVEELDRFVAAVARGSRGPNAPVGPRRRRGLPNILLSYSMVA